MNSPKIDRASAAEYKKLMAAIRAKGAGGEKAEATCPLQHPEANPEDKRGLGMKINEPPSCEWRDPKGGLQLHNCCDADGCPDAELTSRAIDDRVGQISKQLDCPHGLTNRERRALAHERDRLRRYLQSIRPPIAGKDVEVPKMKAEGEKLLWLAKKSDRESGVA